MERPEVLGPPLPQVLGDGAFDLAHQPGPGDGDRAARLDEVGEVVEVQVVGAEVVVGVDADRRVEDTFDREVRKRHPAQRHLGAKALASDGQHRVGCVDADDAVAACDQFAGEEAGAAAEIEHGAHALRVGAPKLMEE